MRGTVRRDANGLRIEHARSRLLELKDQLDQKVSLEGRLWSMNDNWWFDYRGAEFYVTDAKGHLPHTRYSFVTAPAGHLRLDPATMAATAVQDNPFAVSARDHGRRVRNPGKLVRQLRPSLDQITQKSDRDLVPCYVIRNAAIKYLEPEESYDSRFRTLYATPFLMVNGVPELLAESSMRRNILGNETTTMLFYERNAPAIEWTLRNATDQRLNVLAKRMADDKLAHPLRLLYATMLAAASDSRGASFC